MERSKQEAEGQMSFEDLPRNAQEAIVDLIVSIIRNTKKQEDAGDDKEQE